jgi:hypothetical protein
MMHATRAAQVYERLLDTLLNHLVPAKAGTVLHHLLHEEGCDSIAGWGVRVKVPGEFGAILVELGWPGDEADGAALALLLSPRGRRSYTLALRHLGGAWVRLDLVDGSLPVEPLAAWLDRLG